MPARIALFLIWVAGWAAADACASPRALRPFASGGEQWLALSALARARSRRVEVGPDGRLAMLGRESCVEFESEGRKARIDGVQVWLQFPVARVRGLWAIRRDDAERLIDPLLAPAAHVVGRGTSTVVLDPGHGGEDGGAVSPYGAAEKDIVLQVARRLRLRLLAMGFRVVLTRAEDRSLDLDARVARAARANADLFVSLHLNSSENGDAEGAETYVLSRSGGPSTNGRDADLPGPRGRYPSAAGNAYDGASAVLGYHLQRGLVERAGQTDRGLRQARFAVLKHAPCPSALVECAFLSNGTEARRLEQATYQERLAAALAAGIRDYTRDVLSAQLTAH